MFIRHKSVRYRAVVDIGVCARACLKTYISDINLRNISVMYDLCITSSVQWPWLINKSRRACFYST